MIEHMFDTATLPDTAPDQLDPLDRLDRLDTAATLTAAEANERALTAAEYRRLALAAHWADLHGTVEHSSAALPGAERTIAVGGDGTPAVAEFCPAELAAALAVSPFAATCLIADALDLRHRLPILWRRIRDGQVKPSIGRRVAQHTRALNATAAALVDAKVSRWSDRLTWARLSRVVQAAIIEADPDAAGIDAEVARSQLGVWVNDQTDHGTKTAFIRADASDLAWFDDTLDQVAESLAVLGDTSTKDVRRARAVGILAHPQHTLDLSDQAAAVAAGAEPATIAEQPSQTSRQPDPQSRSATDLRPRATLYVHLSEQALTGHAPVARVEDVGPVLADTVKAWLGHCQVTVKPVIDLPGMAAVDAYEIPDRMREAVHLVCPADCFPFASSRARTGDIDHTDAYVPRDRGGPPGQTRVGNLGPMTRLHHRIKTHSRWQVRQPFTGVYVWKSPHGRHYLVDHTGTRPAATT
jgi:Domain of unknown function (DUF222)